MAIDLRSDTVTKPTPEMRQQMFEASVGDDVYGEDPTINQLEEFTAHLLGKAAGLFVPSGTMANQVAILAHTDRGDEVFIHRDSHAYYYEGGAAAMWSGVTWNLLDGDEGTPSGEILQQAIRPTNIHHPRPRLLSLENTHNRAGGAAIDLSRMMPSIDAAKSHGLLTHLDGARLFNAAVALQMSAAHLVAPFDSVSVCLSKGLGAPVGSVLVGSPTFIERARVFRKWLGGGMRQAGILAAAGLYALTHNVERLSSDHEQALRLVNALRARDYEVFVPKVPTNMVMVDLPVAAEVAINALKQEGILVGAMGPQRLRLVTHLDVDDPDIDETIGAFGRIYETLHA